MTAPKRIVPNFDPTPLDDKAALPEVIRKLNVLWLKLTEALGWTPKLHAYRTVTAADRITAADQYVRVDTSGGAVALALPDPASCVGRTYTVKLVVGPNTVTLTPDASTIEGAVSWTWGVLGVSYQLRACRDAVGVAVWDVV